MRIEKNFTSNHRLREWLESKSWEYDSTEMFYVWLENFFEEGNRISVKEHRAGAALALIAAFLYAFEAEMVAQSINERRSGIQGKGIIGSVNMQSH